MIKKKTTQYTRNIKDIYFFKKAQLTLYLIVKDWMFSLLDQEEAKSSSFTHWASYRYGHRTECHPAVTSEDGLMHSIMWDLDIMLGETRQSQKITEDTNPFIWNVQNKRIHKRKVDGCLPGAVGNRKWRVSTNRYRVSFGDKKCPQNTQ